jgi:hypothetical protein
MADIDLVLQRLRDDLPFRERLQADPRAALAEYHLSDADLDRIEQHVAAGTATSSTGVATFFAPPVAARSWWRSRSLALTVGAAAAIGLVAGVAVDTARRPSASALSSPGSTVPAQLAGASLSTVGYSACPGTAAGASVLGTFHGGDRVWVIGRDDSRQWLQVRDPAGEHVWVPAATVTATAVDALPVVACDLDDRATTGTDRASTAGSAGTAPVPPDEASTTTTTSSTVPGVSPPSSTTTTSPLPSSTTTSTPVAPGDHAGPSIQGAASNPNQIWEHYAPGGGSCVSQITTTVSAGVTDPSGVAAVQLEWRLASNGSHGTVTMTPTGATWRGIVGPFEWNANAVPASGTDITITVQARDGAGNTSTATTTAHLHSAQECIG